MDNWLNLADTEPGLTLGPLDGRYRAEVAPLINYFSEAALNRMRVHVEVEWFIELAQNGALPGVPPISDSDLRFLRNISAQFDGADIARLAEIERQTVHDVKAVEYLLKEKLAGTDLAQYQELIHFGCTSEDINNLSYALLIKAAVTKVWLPQARRLVTDLSELAHAHKDQPLLARTHGQPATPTTLGKELAVLAHRLQRQLNRIERQEYLGKINGATGTYGAHLVAVPTTDWVKLSANFVERLGLKWNPLTTQIESHDWQAELYSDVARFGRILHNLATDFWSYISLGYFAQVRGQGTIGSSAMPHKVNPIRFENAEANLELSAAIFDTLSATLVTSRLQRDLTDSTSQRNIGVAFGHSLLAISNVTKGIAGLDVDPAAISADLAENWEVLAEPIQSTMRAAGLAGVPNMEDPYERLRDLTRGRRVTGETVRDFVATLGLPPAETERLQSLTPDTYTGAAATLVTNFLPRG